MNIIGHRINNYEVLHLIGEGGMGAVYVAQHVVIGRKAAIKVLRREFSEDVGLVARFMNEARAAAAIGHPNIVDVVDVGNLPDGTPYMMMEFLVGEDLSKRLAKVGRLSLAQALPIALQAGSAVAAAHEKGIVHRDLKPENLFLVQDVTAPGHERVKVLDFGIAKLRGDFTSGSQTKTGSLLGTPQYMSPEQCRGIPDGIDHRSDIYSFGIILYEMMCGAPPFVSEGLGDMLLMHLSQEPDLPSSRNPDIPGWLERVIL
jgi:serine/threonine protein kinase